MDGFLEKIAEILKEDETAPSKQRHTATRIYERLKDELGYTGGPCQVRRAVNKLKDKRTEAFVPLVSIPGEAEASMWSQIAMKGARSS